jgi:PAS domain S-box-containing protein
MADEKRARHSLRRRITVTTLLIFLVSMWALSYYASRMLREDMERLLADQQSSTVSYVAAELNHALEERLLALEKVASSIDSQMLGDPVALQKMLESRLIFQDMFNAGVVAVSQSGIAVADVPLMVGRRGTNYANNGAVHTALIDGKSAVGGPVIGQILQQPIFNITAPIRGVDGKVIGTLSGVINLAKPNFLDRVGDHSYGKSGGYVVIDPQHNVIVAATNKRRVMQKLPSPGTNEMVDRRRQGFLGPAVSVNSEGVEVLSSIGRIPAAGWVVVATLPTEEAFAPIREMRRRIVFAAVLLSALSGMISWWLLRRQFAPLHAAVERLAGMSDAAKPLEPLPISKQDEIGRLVGGFNQLLITLGEREAQLKTERDFFSTVLQQSSDGVVLFDPGDLHIREVNSSICRMLGYERDELLAMTYGELMDRDMQLATENITDILHGELRLACEWSFRKKDGIQVAVEVNTCLVETGGRRLIMVNLRDITERKTAQLMGEQLLRRIESLMKHANDCVMMLDSNTRILEVSDGCARTYGYTREELLGMRAIDLRPAQAREEAPDIIQRLMQHSALPYQTWHCHKDGSRFPVEVGAAVIDDGDERFIQVIIRDVSERVRERSKLELELAAYAKRLEQASQRVLAVQEESKRRFSGELHDRTSPNLAAIRINLAIIGRLSPAQSKERTERLEDTQALVDDTDASLREICTELRPPVLDYAGLAAALESYAQQFARRNGIAVRVDCTNGQHRLEPALESLLFRIYQEALTNCVKHANAGSIAVALSSGARPITLTIADDGNGFDLQMLEKVEQINGLGLLNMREMIELSGGRFVIESRPGQGTRIEVII